MSMTLNERNPHVTPIAIGSRASTMNVKVPGIYFRKHSRIKSVKFVDRAAIAKDNTNHITVTLQDNAGSPVAYAAADTSDLAVAAITPYALALSTPVGDLANAPEADVPAGTMLVASVVGGGTAVTTDAVLLVEWYPL